MNEWTNESSNLWLPVSIACASLTFHCSATSLARGSSGFGALSRAWMDSRTVRICNAGLHFSVTHSKTETQSHRIHSCTHVMAVSTVFSTTTATTLSCRSPQVLHIWLSIITDNGWHEVDAKTPVEKSQGLCINRRRCEKVSKSEQQWTNSTWKLTSGLLPLMIVKARRTQKTWKGSAGIQNDNIPHTLLRVWWVQKSQTHAY